MRKQIVVFSVGISLLISPLFAYAQTTSQNASLIASLTQLVQVLEQEIQQLILAKASSQALPTSIATQQDTAHEVTSDQSISTSTASVSATCHGSPYSGSPHGIAWSVAPSGGSGLYTYQWMFANDVQNAGGNDASESPQLRNPIENYGSAGTKSATVVISSGGQSATAACSATIGAPAPSLSCGFNTTKAVLSCYNPSNQQFYVRHVAFTVLPDSYMLANNITPDMVDVTAADEYNNTMFSGGAQPNNNTTFITNTPIQANIVNVPVDVVSFRFTYGGPHYSFILNSIDGQFADGTPYSPNIAISQ